MTTTTSFPSMAIGPCDEGTRTPFSRRKKWTRPSDRTLERTKNAAWVIRCRADFLDARAFPMKHHHRTMLLILESMCGLECFCLPVNQEVAALYGCHRRQLQVVFAEMEDEGLILRVLGEGANKGRDGIILRKRSDPELPVADTDESLDRAVEDLKRAIDGEDPRPRLEARGGAACSAPGARHGTPRGRAMARPDKELKNKTREETTTDRVSSSSSPAPPPREGPPPAEPVAPAGPLDPRIASSLEEHFPDAADRAEFEAKLPAWLAVHLVERIVKAIAETAAIRKKKPIHSLAGYAERILANWKADGKVTARAAKESPPPAASSPERARADADAEARAREEKSKAERAALAAAEAERLALQARWDALPEADRAAILAQVRAENPGLGRWKKSMLDPLCWAAMPALESTHLA